MLLNPTLPSVNFLPPLALCGLQSKQPALAFFGLPRLWFILSLSLFVRFYLKLFLV